MTSLQNTNKLHHTMQDQTHNNKSGNKTAEAVIYTATSDNSLNIKKTVCESISEIFFTQDVIPYANLVHNIYTGNNC